MDAVLEQLLADRYPIYRRSNNPDTIYSACGFECGPGWLALFIKFADYIETLNIDPQYVRILQIKEKYWTLRLYAEVPAYVDEEVHDLIDRLESESARVCEVCGSSKLEETHEHQCDPAYTTINHYYLQFSQRLVPPLSSQH